jgi:BirA family transcriptional regulator, biotin operon repressor / biotin---[acetyl-CoA-carboxylase] ligase
MKKDLTTLFTGRHCTFLPEVDSTNTYLAGLLRNIELPEGSVIRAVKQSAGRGQKGAIWESEGGKNLLVSFLFYPTFISSKEIFLLNKTFALGLHDFVLIYLKKHVRIKWPNDIYWKNKKVSGILIENSINSSMIAHSILGVGVNINQVSFPDELSNPVSFSLVKHKEFDIEELFNALCACIESRYLKLKNGDHKSLHDDYHSLLYACGEWKTYENSNGRFKGNIQGVDDDGRIKILLENGDVNAFDLKEIKYIAR